MTTTRTTRPSKRRSSTTSWPASAAPTWRTGHRLSRALAAGGAAQARSAAAGERQGRNQGSELAEGSRTRSGARRRSRPGRKNRAKSLAEAARPLTPAELNVGRTAAPARTSSDPIQPGVTNNPMLSPAQLGYNGGLLGMFKGNKPEAVPFTGEPTRETLTQPPAGYQTPSPNFAYGTGPDDRKSSGHACRRDDGQRGRLIDRWRRAPGRLAGAAAAGFAALPVPCRNDR